MDLDQCHRLQQRLAYEIGGRDDGQINVLFCEHPRVITIGRNGSRANIRLSNEQLTHRRLETRWANRGGGCVLHGAGQLAVYPIVPLHWHEWTVGDYLRRVNAALSATLEELTIPAETPIGQFGVWGRNGCLAAVGISVRNWIASGGAFLNVHPSMADYGYIDVVGRSVDLDGRKATMSCLVGERRRPVKMSDVRARLVEHLAAAFNCTRYHIHTGHPALKKETQLA